MDSQFPAHRWGLGEIPERNPSRDRATREHAVDLSPAGALVDGVLAFCQAGPHPVVNPPVGNHPAGNFRVETNAPPVGPPRNGGRSRQPPQAAVPRPPVHPPGVRPPSVLTPLGAPRPVELPSPGVPRPTVDHPAGRPLPNRALWTQRAAAASIRPALPADHRRPPPAPRARAQIPCLRVALFPAVFAAGDRRPSAHPDALSAGWQALPVLPVRVHSSPRSPPTDLPRKFGRDGPHAAGQSDPPCRRAGPSRGAGTRR